MEDPSMPIIRLIHALYILNIHWTDLYPVSENFFLLFRFLVIN